MTTIAKKRVWSVADFARHAFGKDDEATCLRARRHLKKLDAKHEGKLLIPSVGTNRNFTFYPATLARLEPDLFTPIQSIEFRLESLEENDDERARAIRSIAHQTGANTRAIDRLREHVRR